MLKTFNKIFKIVIITSIFFGFSTKISYAVCPVCTIAVGAGLGLSRFLGIDDLVIGIWLGGFLISLSLMSSNWLFKKEIFKKNRKQYLDFGTFVFYIIITFLPLQLTGLTGHPLNRILGIDKLWIGSLLGTLTFLASIYLDKKVRKIKGKQLINYQKVVFPVVLLAIVGLLFYFITR